LGVKRGRNTEVRPLVVVQVPGDDRRYEHYHRVEAESASAEHLRAALDRIITAPEAHRVTRAQKPRKWQEQSTHKPDGEVMPGA
jgi:hypothetical protein